MYDSSWARGSTRQTAILAVLAATWFAIVLVTICHHEPWRDEVRALSIAIASPSLWALPEFLKNEGHPVLWYALLRLGYQVFGSVTELYIVSFTVAAGAVLLFLFRSPFSLGLKFLFVFSILPLYEYSVMARNYGISMLLMFGFAAVYPQRQRHPLVIALLLALLANTNVHSLLIAGILTVLWLWDSVVVDLEREKLTAQRLSRLGLAAGSVLAAALFSLKTAMPDERTIVTGIHHAKDLKDYIDPLVASLRRPWQSMELLLPFSAIVNGVVATKLLHLVQDLLIGALILGLTSQFRLAGALLAGFLAFGYLFNFAYPGDLRHHGILFVFVLVLYWINAETIQTGRDTLGERLQALTLATVLPALLLWGDYLAFDKVRRDYQLEVSSSKSLAEWLNRHPEYQNAIILGEPDFALESLPFYATQRIYIPRESRFGNWIKFTTDSMLVMNLGTLLNVAQALKAKERQPVLIALGLSARELETKTSKIYLYNKMLTWTPSEWSRFRYSTKQVTAFWSTASDENFDLYEIL
jgi:hypothetical protein